MSEPVHIHSVPIGFGATDTTWADRVILVDVDDWKPGPGSAFPYPWAVVVRWTITDGRAVPTGMDLHAMHGQPVTATAWRSVPVAKVIERARNETLRLHDILATFHRDHHLPGPEGSEHESAVGDLGAPVQRRRGRPALYDNEHYRRVADAYKGAGGVRPRKAVAAEFGCEPGDTRVKAWVTEARRRGLIPKV